ncbi:MAG: hypothetical protein SYC29_08135 [Planctomycetota bacterium]|nr:hypothetical protein [Planctomycetota bacterium]
MDVRILKSGERRWGRHQQDILKTIETNVLESSELSPSRALRAMTARIRRAVSNASNVSHFARSWGLNLDMLMEKEQSNSVRRHLALRGRRMRFDEERGRLTLAGSVVEERPSVQTTEESVSTATPALCAGGRAPADLSKGPIAASCTAAGSIHI